MNNALRTRQRMFALALPLTAALYIGAEGINPKGTDQIVTTTAVALKVLPIAAKHHTQLYVSGSLTELALGALIISYGAIAMLIRKRGSTAATIAVLLGGIGAFCGVVVNVLVGINLAAAATAHVSHDAAARLLVTNFNSGPGQAFTDVYAFSEFVAPIIMGVALWRSGRVPRWLAVLFALGFELAEQTASVGLARVILQMAPFALAMVLLSVRIWRAADQVAPVSDDHEARWQRPDVGAWDNGRNGSAPSCWFRVRASAHQHHPRPTLAADPVQEWTVGDLVSHVVGESIMSVRLLHGADAESAMVGLDGDILGVDASAAFVTAASAEYAAFEESGATERIVHHPAMDMPGAQLLGFRIGGLTLHAWDLARCVVATRPSTRSWSRQSGRNYRRWRRSSRRRVCSESAQAGRLVKKPRCRCAFWT